MRINRVEGRFRADADEKSTESLLGMLATAHPEATRAGVEMLEQGGNAIDAACAAGIASGVCEPQASGLGGQSIGLIHFGGRTFAVDGSSRVPSLSHIDRMSPGDELVGHRATTVPSTLATYAWLHEHYGRLPWRELLAPAIRIAREGYRITELQHTLLERSRDELLMGSASGPLLPARWRRSLRNRRALHPARARPGPRDHRARRHHSLLPRRNRRADRPRHARPRRLPAHG